jgi:hypothetical protein
MIENLARDELLQTPPAKRKTSRKSLVTAPAVRGNAAKPARNPGMEKAAD